MPSFHVKSTLVNDSAYLPNQGFTTTADKDFSSSNTNYLIIAYSHLQNCLQFERNIHSKIQTRLTKFVTGRPLALKGPGEEIKLAEATVFIKMCIICPFIIGKRNVHLKCDESKYNARRFLTTALAKDYVHRQCILRSCCS